MMKRSAQPSSNFYRKFALDVHEIRSILLNIHTNEYYQSVFGKTRLQGIGRAIREIDNAFYKCEDKWLTDSNEPKTAPLFTDWVREVRDNEESTCKRMDLEVSKLIKVQCPICKQYVCTDLLDNHISNNHYDKG